MWCIVSLKPTCPHDTIQKPCFSGNFHMQHHGSFNTKQQFKFFNPGEKQGKRVGPVTLSSCELVDAPDQGWDWIEIQHATHCVQLWCYSRRVGAEVKVRRDEEGGGTIMLRLEGGDKRTHRMQLLRLVKPDSEEIEKRQWKHVGRRLKTRSREGRAGWWEKYSFGSKRQEKKTALQAEITLIILFFLSLNHCWDLTFPILYVVAIKFTAVHHPLFYEFIFLHCSLVLQSLTICSKWSKLSDLIWQILKAE